jgi:hypothetical protein
VLRRCGLGFGIHRLRYSSVLLVWGGEADGMRWAGEAREGWRENGLYRPVHAEREAAQTKPEWVGGQSSNRLFSAWRAVKSLGMERPLEGREGEPCGRNVSTNSALDGSGAWQACGARLSCIYTCTVMGTNPFAKPLLLIAAARCRAYYSTAHSASQCLC